MAEVFAIFGGIVAVVKAIPIVDKWLQQFIVFYVNSRIDAMAVENSAALKKAIVEKDQRDLEKAIGNPNAGEPSNLPGTVIRPTLPGVPDSPRG